MLFDPHRLEAGATKEKRDTTSGFVHQFAKPSNSTMRKHRAKSVPKLFEAEELRRLIEAAGVPMRAMILLGVNCGFSNTDCAALPMSAANLDVGWIDYPRPKTGIARRCALWPETVAALRAATETRGKPTGYDGCGLVFINERGSPWVHIRGQFRTDNVTIQFTKLTKSLGLHRTGCGFYALRHVFRTVADEVRDPVAVDLIMGHGDDSMGARYRERIDDARLKAVADHVRAWLFGGETPDGTTGVDGGAPETRTAGEPPESCRREDGDDGRPLLRLFAG